jgi:phosphatidate cytidylyltransferase
MKEFLTRTTTAFFLIIGAFFLIKYVPLTYFSLVLFLLISFGANELIKLCKPNNFSWIIIYLCGAIIGASFTFGKPDILHAIGLVVAVTGIFFLFSVRGKEQLQTYIRDMGIHFITYFYLYIPIYFIFELKKLGPNYLFFLIFVIAIGDSGAYFVGRAIGKHKIYPVASPKKSLEGLIAAIITASMSGWLVLLVFPVEVLLWKAIVTGGIIGLFSQLSDPVESLFKRAASKKDSSSLLPGHGGILDRLDSYVFCAPMLYYIILLSW